MDADDIIEQLALLPHPEGGHYRRVYESTRRMGSTAPGNSHSGDDADRPLMTSIYFLLKEGEISHWHRIDADELWHYYAGAPLELRTGRPGRAMTARRLGTNFEIGELPQLLVPAGSWQSARSMGSYTLIGATVAPGFSFEGFELAPPDFEPSA
jgi:hypothetical protein